MHTHPSRSKAPNLPAVTCNMDYRAEGYCRSAMLADSTLSPGAWLSTPNCLNETIKQGEGGQASCCPVGGSCQAGAIPRYAAPARVLVAPGSAPAHAAHRRLMRLGKHSPAPLQTQPCPAAAAATSTDAGIWRGASARCFPTSNDLILKSGYTYSQRRSFCFDSECSAQGNLTLLLRMSGGGWLG